MPGIRPRDLGQPQTKNPVPLPRIPGSFYNSEGTSFAKFSGVMSYSASHQLRSDPRVASFPSRAHVPTPESSVEGDSMREGSGGAGRATNTHMERDADWRNEHLRNRRATEPRRMSPFIEHKWSAFLNWLKLEYKTTNEDQLNKLLLEDFENWWDGDLIRRKLRANYLCEQMARKINTWQQLFDWATKNIAGHEHSFDNTVTDQSVSPQPNSQQPVHDNFPTIHDGLRSTPIPELPIQAADGSLQGMTKFMSHAMSEAPKKNAEPKVLTNDDMKQEEVPKPQGSADQGSVDKKEGQINQELAELAEQQDPSTEDRDKPTQPGKVFEEMKEEGQPLGDQLGQNQQPQQDQALAKEAAIRDSITKKNETMVKVAKEAMGADKEKSGGTGEADTGEEQEHGETNSKSKPSEQPILTSPIPKQPLFKTYRMTTDDRTKFIEDDDELHKKRAESKERAMVEEKLTLEEQAKIASQAKVDEQARVEAQNEDTYLSFTSEQMAKLSGVITPQE